MPKDVKLKSIFWDIFWTVLTFGLFNFWVQFRQIQDVNDILGRDQYSLFKVFLFSVLTLGLYFVYHEYKLTRELHPLAYGTDGKTEAILCGVAAFFGLWFIVDSYQQSMINTWVKKNNTINSSDVH